MSFYGAVIRFVLRRRLTVDRHRAKQIAEKDLGDPDAYAPMSVTDCGLYYQVRTNTDRSGGNCILRISVSDGAILSKKQIRR